MFSKNTFNKESATFHGNVMQDQDQGRDVPSKKLFLPLMALLAGILGGVFGIGGGILIRPLLL